MTPRLTIVGSDDAPALEEKEVSLVSEVRRWREEKVAEDVAKLPDDDLGVVEQLIRRLLA